MISLADKNCWGGRWVTIPQPSAPQADALPIELRPPRLPRRSFNVGGHIFFITRKHEIRASRLGGTRANTSDFLLSHQRGDWRGARARRGARRDDSYTPSSLE